ncbi:MAG: hypothetical protein RJA41_735, partial [Actinomycetota bacterium]
ELLKRESANRTRKELSEIVIAGL